MTLSWDDFVDALGEPESSARFASLLSKIRKAPVLVERYRAYTGRLPAGVVTGQDEPTIVAMFGNPSQSGDPKQSPLIGFIHRWIRYYRDNRYRIRFEFSMQGGLQKLSLERVMQ